MEKNEFQKILKQYFKKKGFQFKGNNGHRIWNGEYLVGVCLEHHSYCKAYSITYGVVYLPDNNKIPFSGWFDWSDQFLFTKQSGDNLEKYSIEKMDGYDETNLVDYFEYELRDPEELLNQIESNVNRKMELVFDKTFVFNYYSDNLHVLARLPACTIEKLLSLYEFDRREISRLRKQWGYDKYDFECV